jgi:uncharacterized protein GlcG (DUF336 family)
MKHTALVVLVLMAGCSGGGSRSVSPSRRLTAEVAQTIAREAMARCRARGYRATVLVVDAQNEPKVLLRDDGATASTTEVARIKATSAMLYNRPSGIGTLPGTIPSPGGVPIKVGDETIGAVGISSTPGGAGRSGADVECANAGLSKVADRLK